MKSPSLLSKANYTYDVITVSSVKDLPSNSKSGSIVEVTNNGVKELKANELLSSTFYILVSSTSTGNIAQSGDKVLTIQNNLDAAYYDQNNQKKTIHYNTVAIQSQIYREYELQEDLQWKNLNNIKIFVINKNKTPYIYTGEKWEPMDYVQKSDFAFDNTPTEGSSDLLTSGVIYNELNNKADLVNGKVPSDQLPSYVDDVIEFSSLLDFPQIGESGKIYIDVSTNSCYRWSGSTYIEIQSPIELDEQPTQDSENAVQSGGVYSALQEKQDIISDLSEIRQKAETALQTETDPTVPSWAKQATKPSYTASEVGALPDSTVIPDDLSDLNDDSTHRLVTDAEKSTWNSKQDELISGANIKTINNTSILGSGDISVSQNGIASITAVESQVSGGNNVVTITETNGNTTVFNIKNGTDGDDGINGQDGADGVSLGEIALVQTTGDSEESVMSQKAVTKYTKKITDEDLAGTSDWIRTRLTEEGWKIGFRLSNINQEIAGSSYCITSYIPVSGISEHSITFCYMLTRSDNNNICLYKSDKSFTTGWYYAQNKDTSRTVTVSASFADTAYIRMTCDVNDLPYCYIYDNTTGEYIFKGSDLLDELNINNNISLNYFRGTLLKQEKGSNEVVTISQKAITDAINYNVNIERGTSVAIYGSLYTKLNEYQANVLNYDDVMSVRFLVSGSDGGNGSDDWRYIALGTDGHLINFSAGGAPILSWYASNQGMLPNGGVHPVVATIVINRVTGVVDYYKNTTLICSDTQDRYKKDNFLTSDRVMRFSGGDYYAKFYGVQLYDCDISKFWRNARYTNNEIDAVQSEVVRPFILTYEQSHEWTAIGSATSVYSKSWYTITDNGDGTATMIRKDGTKGIFYFTGYTPTYNMIHETDFYCDKPFTIAGENNTTQLYDEEGELLAESANGTAIPFEAGRYKIRFYWYQSANGITTTEDGATITIYSKRRKYVGCLAHFDFSTLYNKKLYDNVSNQFYTLYTDSTLKTESLTHELSQLPLRGIYTAGNLFVPHYVGEIKVYNGNVYIADNTWTWKKINNS